jgi:hypothetical protein
MAISMTSLAIGNLNSHQQVWVFVSSTASAFVGAAFIFYAKLPLYRARQFLTFGRKHLPARRRFIYRLGYSLVIFGCFLLGSFALSNH